MLYKSEQRLLKVYTYKHTYTTRHTHIWEMLIVLFPLSPFFRGRRQGRQPLNPATPRRVVWEAKHSFSYPGARPCRRPSQKSFSLVGFSRFSGLGWTKRGWNLKMRFGGPKNRKKVPFWHIFRTIFRFSEVTKWCKLQHFCVLTSLAGAMQKRRKCCKYQYFLDPRCTKHCKYQCFWKPSKKTL